MNKTKEQILKHHTNLSVDPKYSNNGDILEAMDEYAKIQCIGFLEWTFSNKYISSADGFWYEQPKYAYEGKYWMCIATTNEQLYEKFIKSIEA